MRNFATSQKQLLSLYQCTGFLKLDVSDLKNGFFTTYAEATKYCRSVAFIQLEIAEFQHDIFVLTCLFRALGLRYGKGMFLFHQFLSAGM